MTGSFKWQEVYARLEQVRQALEAGRQRPPEEVRRILRERAQAVARPVEEAPTPTEVLELLVVTLAGERHGIEMAHVLEVVPLRELTPLPGTSSFVLGVMNHRGRILSVLDLRRLLGIAGQGLAEGRRAVVVDAAGMTLGISVDAVAGTVRVGAHDLAPPPASLTGDRQAFVVGVTGEMVGVLDLEALARDPRITVKDEAGSAALSMGDAA